MFGAAKSTIGRATWRGRRRALDTAIRLGLVPYRPLVWEPELWSETYAGGRHRTWEHVTELGRYSILAGYLRHLGRQAQVLDIGCGGGALLAHLDPSCYGRYVGIDPTPQAIAAAEARRCPRAAFVVGDPMEVQLQVSQVVICNEVLYMVPDHRALLSRIQGALLEPGGHLLVSLWGHPGVSVIWRALDDLFERIDRVSIVNPAHRGAPDGWTAALYRLYRRPARAG
jgi:SAM-dependent methyltransferase